MQSNKMKHKWPITNAVEYKANQIYVDMRVMIEFYTQETFISKGDLPLHLSTNKKKKTYWSMVRLFATWL